MSEEIRLLTEEEVLKKLAIPDFRHMTKDKVIELASMYERMAPEVAMKALEQFPEFASTVKEAIVNVKETATEAMKQSNENARRVLDACDRLLEHMDKALEDDALSVSERMDIFKGYTEVIKLMDAIREKQNDMFKGVLSTVVKATLGFAALVLVGLGGRALLGDGGAENDSTDAE